MDLEMVYCSKLLVWRVRILRGALIRPLEDKKSPAKIDDAENIRKKKEVK